MSSNSQAVKAGPVAAGKFGGEAAPAGAHTVAPHGVGDLEVVSSVLRLTPSTFSYLAVQLETLAVIAGEG
jgi:hypothetical protein